MEKSEIQEKLVGISLILGLENNFSIGSRGWGLICNPFSIP
jgi:hypothetical protein